MTVIDFIEAADKVHAGKYDYTDIVKVHHKEKMPIICHEHGVFGQSHYSHLAGNGCPTCKHKTLGDAQKVPITKLITQ